MKAVCRIALAAALTLPRGPAAMGAQQPARRQRRIPQAAAPKPEQKPEPKPEQQPRSQMRGDGRRLRLAHRREADQRAARP